MPMSIDPQLNNTETRSGRLSPSHPFQGQWFRLYLVVLACFAVTHSVCGADDSGGVFKITRDGQPTAVIRVPVNPSDVETKAAEDLQKYVEMISGASLKITSDPELLPDSPAILIGAGAEAMQLAGKWLTEEHVGLDGYIIRTYYTTRKAADDRTPNRLVLLGRQVPIHAHMLYGSAEKDPDFGIGTRYAVFELLYQLGCRFYAPHELGECIPTRRTLEVPDISLLGKPDFRFRRLWRSYFSKMKYDGAELDRNAYAEWCVKNQIQTKQIIHTQHFFKYVVPDRLYEQHPEWFAKTSAQAAEGSRQLCLSNPEVQKMFIDAACKKFKDMPPGGTFSLTPNDTSPDQWCQCPNCKAMDGQGGLAQRMVTFANIVAAEVEKTCPGHYFPFLVEYYLPGSPVADDGTVRIMCHPSLIPDFTNKFCPYHSPYDTSCPRSAHVRWAMSAWDRVSDQMAARDYHMWSLFLPHANTWAVGPRIRFFRDSGVKWYLSEVLGRSPDCDLSMYIVARMLWDADRDPDAIIDEFFQLYFGQAGPAMESYYRYLNELCRKGHYNGSVKYLVIYDQRGIAELRKRLRFAATCAQTDISRQRIEREALALKVYSEMVNIWAAQKKWDKDGIKTPQVAGELKVAVDRMDNLLRQVDGKMIVAEHCAWWDSTKANLDKIITTAFPRESDR